MKLFSLVIPHKDDLSGLERTLSAISRQALPPGCDLEIIVVDNGGPTSSTAVAEVIQRHSCISVRLVHEPKTGASHARNTGFAASIGQWVAFLDCDCEPDADWIEQTINALAHVDVAGGPVLVTPSSGRAQLTTAEALDLLFGFNSRLSFERDGLLLTANIAMNRPVLEKVGPFREKLSEDRDWCKRAAAMGYRLSLEEAMRVGHRAIRCEQRLRARWSRVTRETYHFQKTYGQGELQWLAYLAKVALSPAFHAPRLFTDSRMVGCSWRFKCAAAVALFKLRWLRVRTGVEAAWRS